jgi:hypothetical protein
MKIWNLYAIIPEKTLLAAGYWQLADGYWLLAKNTQCY